jgi:Fe-S-cluster containining protein
MADSLERIYRSVPTVKCKGLCSESCGPIMMSPEEHRRVEEAGVDIMPPDELLQLALLHDFLPVCPALVNNRCSVYEVRPLICRLWGAAESLPCPYGCEVTPGLLVDEGAHELIRRSLLLPDTPSPPPADASGRAPAGP